MRRRTLGLITFVAIIPAVLLGFSIAPSDVEITRASGGSIRTVLSPSIVLNEKSSLQREWIAIRHGTFPVKLKGTPGVKTIYESGGGYGGDYKYQASYEIEASEPISAIEVRFLTFDVWGERGKSLVHTEVQDFSAGVHKLEASWNLYSENEASEFYASLAYVARVRTRSGKMLVADSRPVVEEARKFYSKFTETDLEPEKPGKPTK